LPAKSSRNKIRTNDEFDTTEIHEDLEELPVQQIIANELMRQESGEDLLEHSASSI